MSARTRIRVYRGRREAIHPPLADGELFWDRPTKTLYVGEGGVPVAASGGPAGPAGGVLAGAYPDPTFARPVAFTDGPNTFAADQAVRGVLTAASFLAAGALPGVLPGYLQLGSPDGSGGLLPYGFLAPGLGAGAGAMWVLPAGDAAGVLTSDGALNLSFRPAGGTPTGPAGGDLGGAFPYPEVLNIDGGTWE